MEYFFGKINYPIILVRVIAILLFGIISLILIANIHDVLIINIHIGAKIIRFFGVFIILTSSFLICVYLTRDLVKQRFNIAFHAGTFVLQNIYTRIKHDVIITDIIGYSTSDTVTKYRTIHCVILYVNPHTQYEFSKLVFSNLKQLKVTFKSAGILYLGHEPNFKNHLGKRNYKYN